jgi:hypothetical protein
VDWAPTLNLTKSDDKKSLKIARINELRDLRRKKRRHSVNLTYTTGFANQTFNLPSLGEEISSAAEEVFQRKVNIEQQTENYKCLNCQTDPFVKLDLNIAVEAGCQTDLSGLEFDRLKSENIILKKQLKYYQSAAMNVVNPLDEKELEKNDSLVNFYTGLKTYALLRFFFDFCSNFVVHNEAKNVLNKFSEFLLVMIKLRLNVPYKDLACRFNVDESTASRIFYRWIDGMFHASKNLIIWPEKNVRTNSMPVQFKELYGDKIASIIDCFEVFIIRPSNLLARAQTWSHYKSHNTVKFLISITPQGTVNFISGSWGGRVSDKQITAESGFLNFLKPGDMVMADRGFGIEDLLAPLKCSLAIPSFTRGKSQMSYDEVKNSRDIANLRIHVERMIGLIRNKFPILSGIVTIDMLITRDEEDASPLIDKIAHICCAIVNISDCIVNNGNDK